MSITNRLSVILIGAVASGVMSTSLLGQDTSGGAVPVTIENFGRVNTGYYRGAQPDGRDYRDLSAIGVKTVVNLRTSESSEERRLVEGLGMTFVHIPLDQFETPPQAQVAAFLEIVNDPANQPVFVHCKGGKHRTGALTAAYRMTVDGWTAAQAYEEMKQFKFKTFIPHTALKSFVFAFRADRFQTASISGR